MRENCELKESSIYCMSLDMDGGCMHPICYKNCLKIYNQYSNRSNSFPIADIGGGCCSGSGCCKVYITGFLVLLPSSKQKTQLIPIALVSTELNISFLTIQSFKNKGLTLVFKKVDIKNNCKKSLKGPFFDFFENLAENGFRNH
ncbi:hypothetical protein BpHYR1_040344 [Brachionus plicatilis]|uniref:Uncharacterized protein n=1 Tax=Brachionus plicatilis TaxID=10195 RepID=A0A3M7PCR6_BRAPC|nr:hypothetical protein BpHYR1_040344 [Brachionus plicatilis]